MTADERPTPERLVDLYDLLDKSGFPSVGQDFRAEIDALSQERNYLAERLANLAERLANLEKTAS